jgi:putative phosphoesterase
MKVLVISDTHMPLAASSLPKVLVDEAKSSDCCLHCGDFVDYSVCETLSGLTKVYGVCGNMDDETVSKKLPQKQVIKLEEVTVGLIHGGGNPRNLISYINNAFSRKFAEIDIFVFGHSHKPEDLEIENKIYFNPGSVTDKVFAPYRSYGILEINGTKIKRRIVKIG